MANIKKSFNFRNGIQIDEDNLLVTSTGLVGIGTTVPKESLDVVGNVVISGVTSSVFVKTGILTVTTINPSEIIGAGVSIQSGIITNPSMDNTGIVTYYGDGRYLQGLPTSQWEDTDAGFGVLSIYNTGGTVGIATTNPQSTLQVGNNPLVSQIGVGIASAGNITASGTITANTFSGSLTGNVTGNLTGDVTGNADTATLADDAVKLQTARNIGGLSFDGTANIDLPGVNIAGNQNTSGTASNLSGSPSITVSGIDLNGNLDVSGTTTLTGIIEGTAGQNKIPSLYSNMGALPNASSYHGMFAHVHATARGYFSHAGGWFELVNKEADGTVGTSTETYSIGSLSVGTNSPANDVHIRKTASTELQITSDTGTAGLTVGRESGTSNTNNAEFRYGFGSGNGADYSSAQSLEILNYGTGNFNYHLSANNAGAVAGDFHWHRGINNKTLMTLTGIGGSLGIGNTLPTELLHVEGNALITGESTFNDASTFKDNVTVEGTLSSNNTINSDVSGLLTGNVNAVSGVSTFFKIEVENEQSRFKGVGIKTDIIGNLSFDLRGDGTSLDKRIFITNDGRIGIKTDEINPGIDINAVDSRLSIESVGIGTTNPQSAVDMRVAGRNLTGIFANRMYMYPPQVNTTQRNNLQGVEAGALIYNTTLNKLQVYVGSGSYNVANWQDCN